MRTRIALAATALTLAGCSNHTPASTPATPPTASSPAAMATYDGSTLNACRETDAITGNIPQAQAVQHAQQARGEAALSDVPALREIARTHSDAEPGTPTDNLEAMGAAAAIATWCLDHHVTKP